MIGEGIEPNAACYTALARAHLQQGRASQARKWCDRMTSWSSLLPPQDLLQALCDEAGNGDRPPASLQQEVQPLGDQVLVEELEVLSETKSGILLADGAAQTSGVKTGIVRKKGSGRSDNKRDPFRLEALLVGDTVLWDGYSNTAIGDDKNNRLYLVPVNNIKAKLTTK